MAEVELLVPPAKVAEIAEACAVKLQAEVHALRKCRTIPDLNKSAESIGKIVLEIYLGLALLLSKVIDFNDDRYNNHPTIMFFRMLKGAYGDPEKMRQFGMDFALATDKALEEILGERADNAP